MLQLFTINQESFAFDSESGALYQLDELSRDLMQLWLDLDGHKPQEDQIRALALAKNHEYSELLELNEELSVLKGNRALFSQPLPVTVDQLYPDQPRIKAMCLHLCHDCNLRCRYCFAGTGEYGMGKRSMLDVATGRRAVDFLIESSGTRHNLDIDFFGGEPLMNWPVVQDLVSYCEKRGAESGKSIRLTLTTNASLLDDAKIAYINEHFKNVVLSIDGRREVHDYMRPDAGGHGTWDRTVERIRRFVAARGDKEYYLRGTYTAYNKDFSEDVLALAEIAPQISIEPVVCSPEEPYALKLEDLPQLKSEYAKLAEILAERRRAGNGFNFFHFMIDNGHSPCIYKRLKGCGAGTEYCAVTPDGDIYPCHQLVGEESFIMGNVNDNPVKINAFVQAPFKELLLPDQDHCQGCWARYHCGGGCLANAWHSSGNLKGQNLLSCELMKARLESALYLSSKETE